MFLGVEWGAHLLVLISSPPIQSLFGRRHPFCPVSASHAASGMGGQQGAGGLSENISPTAVMRFMGDAPLKGQSELDVLCTLLKVSHHMSPLRFQLLAIICQPELQHPGVGCSEGHSRWAKNCRPFPSANPHYHVPHMCHGLA